MIDFGALPPEINSGRMYTGPGAGPLLAAAAAWDALAVSLSSTSASYGLTVTEVTSGPWLGPASMAMLTAAAPFAAWLSATATQAEESSVQANAAVAAYEAAFAMTVPPPLIAANRAQLMLLIATNFFGQNTPAIAATEAEYAEMWAQDATAMHGYAGSSAAALKVTPFTRPPQTTTPGGLPGQAAAVSHATAASHGTPTALPSTPLHAPATLPAPHGAQPTPATAAPPAPPTGPKPPLTLSQLNELNTAAKFGLSWTNGSSMHTLCAVWRYNLQFDEAPKAFAAVKEASAGAERAAGVAAKTFISGPSSQGFGGGAPVGASMGHAAQVGGLSVPGNFPGVHPAATGLGMPAEQAGALSGGDAVGKAFSGLPGLPGASATRSAGDHGLRFVPRYGYRNKVMVRPPGAG